MFVNASSSKLRKPSPTRTRKGSKRGWIRKLTRSHMLGGDRRDGRFRRACSLSSASSARVVLLPSTRCKPMHRVIYTPPQGLGLAQALLTKGHTRREDRVRGCTQSTTCNRKIDNRVLSHLVRPKQSHKSEKISPELGRLMILATQPARHSPHLLILGNPNKHTSGFTVAP